MKFSLLLLTLTLSLSSFASKEGGNGGGVLVCGKKMELYDFYEGQSPRGHNLQLWKVDKKLTMNDYIQKALAHIQKDIPEVQGLVSEMVTKILSTKPEDLFIDNSFPFIPDANISLVEKDCRYQQAANWNERFHKLFISEEIFQKLNSMNQAGLILHEAIYKLSRDTEVATENSDLVREVVAKVFSEVKLTQADSQVISSQEAKKKATKMWCDYAKENFEKIEEAKISKEDRIDLITKTSTFCLKNCLVPEGRQLCEEKLGSILTP
jgi:hypothetical protein